MGSGRNRTILNPGPGAPTKLTPEREKVICDALRQGMPYSQACQLAGINYSSFRNWIIQAKRDEADGIDDSRHVKFFRAVQKAEAERTLEAVALIRKAGRDGRWQANAWYLERRYPHQWGTRVEVQEHHLGVAAVGQQDALMDVEAGAILSDVKDDDLLEAAMAVVERRRKLPVGEVIDVEVQEVDV